MLQLISRLTVNEAAARFDLGVETGLARIVSGVKHHLVGVQQAPRAVIHTFLGQIVQAHQECVQPPDNSLIDILILMGY